MHNFLPYPGIPVLPCAHPQFEHSVAASEFLFLILKKNVLFGLFYFASLGSNHYRP